ncbi:CBS domain-containing protein [Stetteria hydrogenophila]
MTLFPRKRFPVLARDIMSTPPVTVDEKTPLKEAARRMCESRVGSVLVVNSEGRLVGIITERDLICLAYKEEGMDLQAWMAMTENPVTVGPDTPVDEVVEKMASSGVRHLPVVDKDGRPLGVISVRDVLGLLHLLTRLASK